MWDVMSVEIYAEGKLVWTHDRKYEPYGYTTEKEHMPESHLATSTTAARLRQR